MCGLKAWGILKLDEIVLVRPVVHIHLRLKSFLACLTFAPIAGVFFRIMVPAEGITLMVPVATIPSVGEHDVCIFIVTYPLPTAFGLRELAGLATQTAALDTFPGG